VCALWSVSACHSFEAQPAQEPKPPVEKRVLEPGPLPPEETPPAPTAEPSSAPAKPVEPGLVATGAPTRGTLPKAVIDEKLKEAEPRVLSCYQHALSAKPDLHGKVDINFVVAPDGKVAHADAAEGEDALPDARVIDCILDEIRKLTFPEPRGGRVFINYPLTLAPPKPGP